MSFHFYMTCSPIRSLRTLLLAVLLLGFLGGSAQNIDSLFASTPREVLSVVDRSGRLDLLDLYNSGLTARVENVFGGQTEMTAKDSTSLTLKTSETSVWKLVMVRSKSEVLLLTLYTVRAGGESTMIHLYNAHWEPLGHSLPTPAFKEFWCPTVGLDPNMECLYRLTASQAPVRIDWDAATQSLIYTISVDAIAEEQRTTIKKCLCPVKQPLFSNQKVK